MELVTAFLELLRNFLLAFVNLFIDFAVQLFNLVAGFVHSFIALLS